MTEPTPKKPRTEEVDWPGYTLNINKAVMKDSEGLLLSDVSAAPAHTLQGLTVLADELLEHLGVKSVADLGNYKFFILAKAIVDLVPVEEAGARIDTSKLNIDKAVNVEYETKSLTEIAKAPVSALQGLSEGAAKLLSEGLNVKTVADLADFKYCKWAAAITALAPYEHKLNAEERKKKTLLKRIDAVPEE